MNSSSSSKSKGIVNSGMKIFHFPEKLRSLPREQGEVLPPIHVRIKPTNICNHDCWFCAYRQEDFQLGETMVERDQIPFDKMMEIVDDLVEMKVEAVTFSGGGEPLVYPYLLQTVVRLAEHGIRFATLTNGARLAGPIAEAFSRHGTWVRVSIDGWDGPSYAKARRVKETEFGKVLANMEAFQKLGGPCALSAVVVVDKENAAHLAELVRTLTDIGVDSIKLSPVIVSNDAETTNHYHAEIESLVREQIALVHGYTQGRTEFSNAYHAQLQSFAKSYRWCPFLQVRPVIGADLSVYSCQDKAYNSQGLLFSIKERRFRDAWLEDKEAFFGIDPALHCNHHCTANAPNQAILEFLGTDPDHLPFV